MYSPCFQTKKSGVPVLSKKDIDFIAEQYIIEFQPDILKTPSPVDIDGFLENYLGTTPDYQLLSHNGIYLGMTVFNDTNRIPVYDLANNRAEYISAKANTVIFDSRLLKENQEHRYRFTAGHEAGHVVFHTSYFAYDPINFHCLETQSLQWCDAGSILQRLKLRVFVLFQITTGWNGRQIIFQEHCLCLKVQLLLWLTNMTVRIICVRGFLFVHLRMYLMYHQKLQSIV